MVAFARPSHLHLRVGPMSTSTEGDTVISARNGNNDNKVAV
jgi:hypothetical protein